MTDHYERPMDSDMAPYYANWLGRIERMGWSGIPPATLTSLRRDGLIDGAYRLTPEGEHCLAESRAVIDDEGIARD